MAIRITPNHKPADLSAYQGLLLNPSFGWHEGSLAGDRVRNESPDLRMLAARVSHLERRLWLANATIWTLAAGVVVSLIARI